MSDDKKTAKTTKNIRSAKKGALKISEVARAAGVSTPTVHYYMKAGLLTPPVASSRNMSYYDPRCVAEIKLIKDLQAKKYLPLAVIKMIMQHERTGQEPAHLAEMREALGEMFRPPDSGEKPVRITFKELIAQSGVSGTVLKKMEVLGLLLPDGNGGDKLYDDIDVSIVRNMKVLLDQGLTIKDLGIFKKYIVVIRETILTLHDRMHEQHKENSVRPMELTNALNNLRSLLAVKAQRQVFIEFMEHQK
ncbi:MAG: MerR family transcriptional regulator [Dehalococcoidia bacterium]|nr:MAG: MerR family transcriptional regulator [Dehalococcoidia bacterium]